MRTRLFCGKIVAFGLLMSLVGGCASKPVELAPQATTALDSLRSDLLAAKQQVQEASNAAKDLYKQPRSDLTAQLGRFNTAVSALNSTRREAQAMQQTHRAETEEYFAKWNESLKTMSEDTAERGQKRMSMAKESIAKLREDAANIRAKLSPFMAELNEANKYMMTDTTKAGLDVVRPKLEEAVKREGGIMKAFDKAIEDIDAIRAGK